MRNWRNVSIDAGRNKEKTQITPILSYPKESTVKILDISWAQSNSVVHEGLPPMQDHQPWAQLAVLVAEQEEWSWSQRSTPPGALGSVVSMTVRYVENADTHRFNNYIHVESNFGILNSENIHVEYRKSIWSPCGSCGLFPLEEPSAVVEDGESKGFTPKSSFDFSCKLNWLQAVFGSNLAMCHANPKPIVQILHTQNVFDIWTGD